MFRYTYFNYILFSIFTDQPLRLVTQWILLAAMQGIDYSCQQYSNLVQTSNTINVNIYYYEADCIILFCTRLTNVPKKKLLKYISSVYN